MAVGGTDDAEFAGAGFEWVGEDGEDGAPDLFGMIVKSEFGEDEVGAIAANGFWFGGERGDAGAVGENGFRFYEYREFDSTNSAQYLACWSDSMAWRSPQAMMSQWLLGVLRESKTASAAQV